MKQREIKFRAWDKNLREMIYPPSERIGIIGNPADSPIFEYMQFTGLKDKNGKEIYEGDLIKINSPTQKGTIGEVIFERNEFCIKINEELRHILDYDLEVIGNIYENPELLTP